MHGAADFLREALAILERDGLVAALRLWREIEGLTLRFDVEGEIFTVIGLAQGIRFLSQNLAPPDIDICCDKNTIMTLIDGKVRLIDCVLAGRLDIRGDVI